MRWLWQVLGWRCRRRDYIVFAVEGWISVRCKRLGRPYCPAHAEQWRRIEKALFEKGM